MQTMNGLVARGARRSGQWALGALVVGVLGSSHAQVPHPLISSTLELLSHLPVSERAKVRFTHLNHTNPAVNAPSPERAVIEAAGCRVAEDFESVEL